MITSRWVNGVGAVLLTGALVGCGAASTAPGSPAESPAGEGQSDRIAISAVTNDTRGDACASVLGEPEEFGARFAVEASWITMGDDGWEGAVDRFWNEEDPEEVTTSIRCQFDYSTEPGGGEDENRGGVSLTLGVSGEDAARLDGDQVRFNGDGLQSSITVGVEGDGVLAAADLTEPVDGKGPTITDDQLGDFLTEEVLPGIRP